MKKLEDKIIKRIYKLETKKTASQIIFEIIGFFSIILSSLLIFSVIVEILNEQSSFDLLDFLRDDFEMIQTIIINNSLLFIQELPFPLTIILVGLILLLILLVGVIIKNSNKINNKLVSLYKFWIK